MLTGMYHHDGMSRDVRHVGAAHWRAGPRLFETVVSSLASLASTCLPVTRIAYPHESEWAALRGDWLRIGADMRAVMRRHDERGKEAR